MKRMNRAVLIAIVALLSAACAKGEKAESMPFEGNAGSAAGRSFAKAPRAEFAADVAPAPLRDAATALPSGSRGGGVQDERKLVRTANVRLRVGDLAESEAAAQALVARLGGYVASSNTSEESVSMSLRVPRSSFDDALAGIEPLGSELWRNVSTEDVTLNWFDLEGRLETKKELMKTLRGYLKSAKTVEDIMAVETRLADLQNEIDSLGGEFRRLADSVDFATIYVEFVLPASRVKNVEPTIGERIGDVLRRTGVFFSALIAFVVGLVTFGAPIVALAALLFWLLFGKVGLLISLYRAIARPKKSKGADGGTAGSEPM